MNIFFYYIIYNKIEYIHMILQSKEFDWYKKWFSSCETIEVLPTFLGPIRTTLEEMINNSMLFKSLIDAHLQTRTLF